ncbi:hypothetical protein D918_05009 [Trichuris suis]|nr:hypothetical protein D918_05009 [Trichuris suis]
MRLRYCAPDWASCKAMLHPSPRSNVWLPWPKKQKQHALPHGAQTGGNWRTFCHSLMFK